MPELALSQTNSDRLQHLIRKAPPRHGHGGEEAPGTPQRLSLTEAAEGLSRAADERSRHDAVLQLVAALLSHPPHLHQELEAASSLVRTLLGIAQPLSQGTDNCFATHALVAELVLAALELLSRSLPELVDDQALVLIIAYTNINDSWTTQPSAYLASDLIASHLPNDQLTSFIVGPVLQAYVRPIFSQTGGSGRSAQTRDVLERPLWKQRDPLAASVFRWAVDNADTSVIAGSWPLFLPVLLTLIEDQEVSGREAGLRILSTFLQKCPSEILLSTGLGTLFEDAVFPLLLFLPDSVESQHSESAPCLAYDVLLQLARVDRGPRLLRRRRLLDRLIRDGILAGHLNTSAHAVVIEALMRYAAAAVDCLGIFAAKHLQNLLQIIDSVMTDPFAAARPSTVVASGKALNALLSNCWPRMVHGTYTEQVFRIITMCWVNSHDQAATGGTPIADAVARIRGELILTSKLLQSIWQGHLPEDIQHKLSEALSREPRLRPLLEQTASHQVGAL